MNTACPCGSGNNYDACCGRLLAGRAQAETAEQLMRSRYTAYARQNANYLVATTHPSKRARNELKVISKSFRGITWTGLEILATDKGDVGDSAGMVEFRASCRAGNDRSAIHERSQFVREDGRWYYLDGDVLPAGAASGPQA